MDAIGGAKMLNWLLTQSAYFFLFLEFDLQVGSKREEAENAMRRLPLISNMVTSANEKTRRAEDALGTAVAEGEAARKAALEAKEIAGGIAQVKRISFRLAGTRY